MTKKKYVKIYNKIKYYILYCILNVLFYFLNKKNTDYKPNKHFVDTGFCKFNTPGLSQDIQKNFQGSQFNKIKNPVSHLYKIFSQTENRYKALIVSLNNDFLWKYVFTDNLFGLLKSYYKTEHFFIRNLPVITYFYPDEKHGAQKYHIDYGQRQLSLMVNLNDLDKDSTHMEYIAKSNKENHYTHVDRYSKKMNSLVSKYNDNDRYTTISDKNNAFLFDAGNGLHKQIGGNKRIALHLNFCNNLVHTHWDKNWFPEKVMSDYFFEESNQKLIKNINKSSFNIENFSLLIQKHHNKLFVPKVLSKNI